MTKQAMAELVAEIERRGYMLTAPTTRLTARETVPDEG